MKQIKTLAVIFAVGLGASVIQADVVISSLGTATVIDFDNTVAGSNAGQCFDLFHDCNCLLAPLG